MQNLQEKKTLLAHCLLSFDEENNNVLVFVNVIVVCKQQQRILYVYNSIYHYLLARTDRITQVTRNVLRIFFFFRGGAAVYNINFFMYLIKSENRRT